MKIDKLLLWEKYRPKTIDDMVLLPRIKEHFKNGICEGNYIFYGHYGTGKTSLARILIGRYSKDTSFLEINSSLYTSIDVLRNEIDDFCKHRSMFSTSDVKYVFLDEFDRVSIQFQDAFKAFIEKYSKVGVRFIITTNHINKISDGIKSRIPSLNFDCKNKNEEKQLMQGIYTRIKNEILPNENQDIDKQTLINIILKKFPDFRATIVEVQNFLNTGLNSDSVNIDNKLKLELFELLYDKSMDYEKIQHFLLQNFNAERIDVMIKLLGRDFVEWSIENKRSIDKLFECNYIITEHTRLLETNTDPIILGMTVIGKFRDVLI